MKANELRIGNWVQFENQAKICVTAVHDDGINYSDDYGGESAEISEIQGIPVTPEILVKAGFEYSDNGMEIWMHRRGYNICRYYDKFAFRVDKAVNVNPIKGVHHLQNLYFSLTYTELKIEL